MRAGRFTCPLRRCLSWPVRLLLLPLGGLLGCLQVSHAAHPMRCRCYKCHHAVQPACLLSHHGRNLAAGPTPAAAAPRSPPAGPPSTHLGGLDLAVAQHLGHQAADERLALVGGAAQPRALDAVPHSKHPPAVARRREAAAAAGLRRCGACTGGDRVRRWGRQAQAAAASSGAQPGAHHAFAQPAPPASCWGMSLLARRPLKAGSASLCCCGRCTLTRGRAARRGAMVKQLMAARFVDGSAARIGRWLAPPIKTAAACCASTATPAPTTFPATRPVPGSLHQASAGLPAAGRASCTPPPPISPAAAPLARSPQRPEPSIPRGARSPRERLARGPPRQAPLPAGPPSRP